jgi:FkbM family methyltransferase
VFFKLLSLIGPYLGKPPGYERFVRLFCPPERIRNQAAQLLALRDEPLILADPNTPLGWNLLFFGNYESDLRHYFKNLLRPGLIVVDVGANVGWHTLLMAQQVGDAGRVIAFEPNPSVREQLLYHVALNRFSQVEVLPYALSDAAGRVKFNAPPVNNPHCGDGFLAATPDLETTDCIEVEAMPFDALLDQLTLSRLDLIKIDVEGFEWRVLRGCEQAIENFRPHIVFEYNSDYIIRCGSSREQLQEFFNRHGYQLFVSTRWHLEALQISVWPEAVNIWAVPLL